MKRNLQFSSSLFFKGKNLLFLSCILLQLVTTCQYVFSQTYCSATSGDCNSNSGNETISNFTLGSINNNSACSPSSYADYTSTVTYPTLETTLTSGTLYNFSLVRFHADFASKYSPSLWIDYNIDGDFDDPGELVYQFSASADCGGISCSNILKSGSFTVPGTGVVSGVSRLRVRLIYTGANGTSNPISPCNNISFGETEDYRVNLSATTPNTITTASISPASYCAGTAISVPYTATGTFNGGNMFTAQLSNASGSFASPTYLGMSMTTTSGTVSGTIPANTPAGSGYRVRVISDNPAATGTDNGVNLTIGVPVTPTVSLTPTPNGAICSNSPVTITAAPVGGGTTPGYQWKINTTIQASTSNSLSNSTWLNGDVVSVTMTSNDACASPATATNSITMTVTNSVTPSVTITPNPSGTVCSNAPVTFTANTTGGGTTPGYVWKLNNNVQASTSNTYSGSNWTNGDVISLTMTSSDACASPATAGNSVTMLVSSNVQASVFITTPDSSVCSGASITFTAHPTNQGGNPVYEWNIDGVPTGSTSATFTTNNLVDNNIVTTTLTSSLACAGAPVGSDAIKIDVSPSLTPGLNISVNPGTTVCQGATVSFTANGTNIGSAPLYAWKLNGFPVGTNSPNYSNPNLNNADEVTCTVTSNETCVTSPTVTDGKTITITPGETAGTLHSVKTTICANTVSQLTLTGNSSNAVQWQSSTDSLTGYNFINGATATTYTSTPLNQNTYFRAAVGAGCTAYTLPLKISITPVPVANFSVSIADSVKATFTNTSTGASTYLWTFGDGESSTDPNPFHQYDSVNVYQVCLKATNSSNCNYTLCQNVNLHTGINNINDSGAWQVYPNPFGDMIYIGTSLSDRIKNIEISDVIGRTVYNEKISAADNPLKLDVSGLKQGTYFIKIGTNAADFIKVVVKY